MKPIAIGGFLKLADAGVHVIQNTIQWNDFNQSGGFFFFATPTPMPTPLPPVDFSSQMIITAGDPQHCDLTSSTITNVCEGPTNVTIYVTSSTCISCFSCGLASSYTNINSAEAVSQSNLPVSIVYTYVSY